MVRCPSIQAASRQDLFARSAPPTFSWAFGLAVGHCQCFRTCFKTVVPHAWSILLPPLLLAWAMRAPSTKGTRRYFRFAFRLSSGLCWVVRASACSVFWPPSADHTHNTRRQHPGLPQSAGVRFWLRGHGVIDAPSLFRIMGWPMSRAIRFDGISSSSISKMIGNMLAAPVFGAVATALLTEMNSSTQADIGRRPPRIMKPSDCDSNRPWLRGIWIVASWFHIQRSFKACRRENVYIGARSPLCPLMREPA